MKNNQILITALIAIIVGAAAFFGGMQYQKSQTRNQLSSRFSNGQNGGVGGQGGRRFGGPGGMMGGVVRGEIISNDGQSVTVKLADGSSKIVLITGSTSITEATSTNQQALTSGKQVLVFGSTNSDGSVTAQNVQLNPQQMGRGAGGGSSSPSSSPK